MTSRLASVLASAPTVRILPCRVRTTTPLVIDFHDDTPIEAIRIAGLTYTTGQALALVAESAQPVVLPIGV